MERAVHVFDNGIRVYDDHLWPTQRERYRARNVHEAEEEDLFVQLLGDIPRAGVFLDIGSAIGYYLLLARRLRPDIEVHGVEPLKSHRDRFLENAVLNDHSPTEFTIHPEAISSSVGVASLSDDGYGSAIKKRRAGPELLAVPTITLDRLVERIGRRVDLCQMDVQGHEAEVLKGADRSLRSGAISSFLIGTHSRKLHRECMELLEVRGYEIRNDVFETIAQPDGILVAVRHDQTNLMPIDVQRAT